MRRLSSSAPSRSVRWIVVSAATLFMVWRVWILILATVLDPSASVDIILDDAYYYLQIAYNLAAIGRSSFDGITSTNGYQPAWMALIGAVECLLRLDKKALFVALQALLLISMAAPLLYCLRRAQDPFFLAAAGGLTASCACFPGVYAAGLETVLFAPAFVALLWAARSGLRAGADKAAWVFALVVMIRLDAVSLLVAYALPLMRTTWREEGAALSLRRGLRLALPSICMLLLYALGNWLLFDSPVPLSGVAKAIGAVPFANWGILYNYLVQAIPVIGTALVLIPIELVWTKFEGGRFYYAGVGLLGLSLAFHYGYYAAFSGWIPWPWYFYAYALMVALLVARLVEIAGQIGESAASSSRWPRRLALSFIVLSAGLVPLGTHVLLTRQLLQNQARGGEPDGSFNRRNVADALRFTREKAKLVVAIGDRAAGLGYWSPNTVQVFALEGLVADNAYLSARRRDQGEQWVRDHVAPRYLIVDRETLKPVRIGAEEQYVVIEPIQGRVVMDHLLTFCFPTDAVLSKKRERDNQVVVLPAPAVRITFDFTKASRCSGAFAAYAEQKILSSESLRKNGVAVEYAAFLAGGFNEALERFDRSLALRVRSFLRAHGFR
jgi:hypothetical protein